MNKAINPRTIAAPPATLQRAMKFKQRRRPSQDALRS